MANPWFYGVVLVISYQLRVCQVAVRGFRHFHGGWGHLRVRVCLVVLLVGHRGVESKGQVLEQSTSTTFLPSWMLVILG